MECVKSVLNRLFRETLKCLRYYFTLGVCNGMGRWLKRCLRAIRGVFNGGMIGGTWGGTNSGIYGGMIGGI